VAQVSAGPRRVFLHIGLPKTGTTYLQTALWENKRTLAGLGVLLPGRHQRRHLLASLDLREDPKLQRRAGDVRHPWQDLVQESHAHPGDVVISHEFFAAAAPHQIQHAVDSFPDAELHMILTARNMVELGLSRWQEWVRNGGQRSVDSYPPVPTYDPTDEWGWGSFDLADVLERWQLAVDPSRIHVLPMDPASTDPTELLARFLGVIGLPGDALSPPTGRVNESLGLVEIELLRRITPHMDDFRSAGDRGRWIRSFLAGRSVMATDGEKFRPGDDLLDDLRARGRRALGVLEEGEYDVVGEVSWLEPTDVTGRRQPREVSDGEMLESATKVVAALMTQVRQVTRERNRLQEELRKAERSRTGKLRLRR